MHLFYRRAFEQKNKNLTRDFYFLSHLMLNFPSIWAKKLKSRPRFLFFFSHDVEINWRKVENLFMTISRTNEDFLKTYPKGSVHTKLKINHLVTKPNFGPLQNFLKTISKLLSDCIKITIRLVQDYLMSSRWLWYHFINFFNLIREEVKWKFSKTLKKSKTLMNLITMKKYS